MGKNPVIKMNKLIKSKENLFFVLCCLFFTFYWLFLIRPAWLGQLGGTFKAKEVPQEYVELKDFLYNQPEFFRTFWVPKRQRFGFRSNNHPVIDAMNLLEVSSSSAVIDWLKRDGVKEQLARWAVKYLIIPYDSEGEIFLEDREYSENKKQITKNRLREIKWLKEAKDFGKIAVFETMEFKDRFWINNKEQKTDNKKQAIGFKLKWQMVNPTKYEVEVENVNEPFTLVFSESFDKNWLAKWEKGDKEEINRNTVEMGKTYSQKTDDELNSFAVSGYNGGKIEIEFELQKYVNYGMIISGVTLLVVIGGLIWLKKP